MERNLARRPEDDGVASGLEALLELANDLSEGAGKSRNTRQIVTELVFDRMRVVLRLAPTKTIR